MIEDVARGRELIRRNLLEGDVPANTHRPWLALPIADAPQQQLMTVDAMFDMLTRQCRLILQSGFVILRWARPGMGTATA
ncbi:hypothetical protein ABT218_37600 [Streptomyces sp. NPDC001455]|uniref:hypothetical protein n=1 Tax=Streptomyces sp. NPDC001455 TaxID=3154518 RepID=UPI0033337A28